MCISGNNFLWIDATRQAAIPIEIIDASIPRIVATESAIGESNALTRRTVDTFGSWLCAKKFTISATVVPKIEPAVRCADSALRILFVER